MRAVTPSKSNIRIIKSQDQIRFSLFMRLSICLPRVTHHHVIILLKQNKARIETKVLSAGC